MQALRDPPTEEDVDWEMTEDVFANVLDSHQPLSISHEGGEFEAPQTSNAQRVS
jgi:hypothetical protein